MRAAPPLSARRADETDDKGYDNGRARPHERKGIVMGLMDKVKAQATQLAEKAQEAGKAGQAKLGTLQTKKQADTLLRELGAHHFAKAKGRGDDQTDTKIAGVMAQLDAHEAEHGQIDLTPGPGRSRERPTQRAAWPLRSRTSRRARSSTSRL